MSEDEIQDAGEELSLDGEGDEYDEANAKSGFNAKKIVLFLVLPIFLLVGAGGGLYFSGMLDKFTGGGEQVEESGDEMAGGKGKKGKKDEKSSEYSGTAYFLQIPNMIVNLSSTDGQSRFLRLSVQLELQSEEDRLAVEAVMPRVVDQFQTYLRELRIGDLRGSQGIYRLQMELLARVNAAAYPIEVKDVLFQEILIQ